MLKKRALYSLRLFVLLAIGLSLSLFTLVLFVLFQGSMSEVLSQAESKYLERQQHVIQGVFSDAQRHAINIADDIGIWNETVLFVTGKKPDYLEEHWPGASLLQAYAVNFVLFKDLQGRDLHSETLDYVNYKPLHLPQGLSAQLNPLAQEVLEQVTGQGTGNMSATTAELAVNSAGLPMADKVTAETPEQNLGKSSILFYQDKAYLVAAMPILSSREDRHPVGVVIFGNILSDAYFHNLNRLEYISFTVSPAPADFGPRPALLEDFQDGSALIGVPLQNLQNQPLLVTVRDSRPINAEGQQIVQRTTSLLLLLLFLFALLLYCIVRYYILRPIEQLSREINQVASSGDTLIDESCRSREFADLRTAINTMTNRLQLSQISQDAFQRMLDRMGANLYVTDMTNDEILFMNDKMLLDFKVEGKAIGSKCWDVLQTGATERCSFCPKIQLGNDENAVITWDSYSDFTGKYYRNTDCMIEWINKKKVHLQHSVDITETKRAERALEQRVEQEKIMSAISQVFISTDDMTQLMEKALNMAGSFMNLSKVIVVKVAATEDVLETAYEWDNPQTPCVYQGPVTIPFRPGKVEYDSFLINQISYLAIDDIAKRQEFAQAFSQGVKAIIEVPLSVAGCLWGLLILDECSQPRAWTESDIQLAQMLGSVVAGVIARNKTEEQLVRMSSIVNSSPHYISYINQNGQFDYFNQGALNMLGYSAEEFTNGGLQTIFDEETCAYARRVVMPEIFRNGKGEFQLPVRRKDGSKRTLSFSAFTTSFNAFGIGVIASDVTENIRIQQELVAAKELAEQSSQAKGEFLSRMSHEMRTPMNAIIGMTTIARASDDVLKKEYCLEKIDDASKHLLGVINDILDISKIEANKFELAYSEFDLEKMLMRVIDVVNFRVDEKDQTLVINVDQDIPSCIISDEQRLAQIITNLLSNAIKFTPEHGTITLSVHKLSEEDNLCTLQMEVVDTGIGISKEQQKRLFRSFEQADGGIARRFGGTGLGLVISKGIIEMMGGRIWVESEPNKGATFAFTVKAETGICARPDLLAPEIHWETLRILVVDDAPEVLEYFMNLSESMHFYCEVAEDGVDALHRIEANQETPFHIVFADWKMPGMNGIELTEQIKKRYGANMVVIMISAAEWSDVKEEARAVGVDRFVPKPLFSSLILNCINECLGTEQRKKQSKATNTEDWSGYFSGCHILLVEDTDLNQEIVLSLLSHTGIVIDCANDGHEAYAMFQKNPECYDMIFMDIHMPEMDGYTATRKIRALDLPEAQSVPIVAMTANVFREDIEKCLAAGMNDHVGKPINISEVLNKMNRYLDCGKHTAS